jgi:hypothetical protein
MLNDRVMRDCNWIETGKLNESKTWLKTKFYCGLRAANGLSRAVTGWNRGLKTELKIQKAITGRSPCVTGRSSPEQRQSQSAHLLRAVAQFLRAARGETEPILGCSVYYGPQ